MTKEEKKEFTIGLAIVQGFIYWLITCGMMSGINPGVESRFIGFDPRWVWFFIPSFVSLIIYKFSKND